MSDREFMEVSNDFHEKLNLREKSIGFERLKHDKKDLTIKQLRERVREQDREIKRILIFQAIAFAVVALMTALATR